MGTVTWTSNSMEVLLAGDLAIARGMYTVNLAPRDGGDPILVDGKYTTTFQRQPDGSLEDLSRYLQLECAAGACGCAETNVDEVDRGH